MESIRNWASAEISKLSGWIPEEDAQTSVDHLIQQDKETIFNDLGGLLDMTKKEVKAFIQDFVERVETQRKIEEQAK